MYKIVFKGQLNDEFVGDVVGTNMMHDYEKSLLPPKIQINGSLYDTSSIKAIIAHASDPDTTSKNDKNMDQLRQSAIEFRADKQKRLMLPPKERAKNTEFAQLVFRAFTGRNATEEEKAEIVVSQEKFFTEHPNYATANPICWKHVVKGHQKEQTSMGIKNQGSIKLTDVVPANIIKFSNMQVVNSIADFGEEYAK